MGGTMPRKHTSMAIVLPATRAARDGREQGHAQVLGSLAAGCTGTRTPTPSPTPDPAGVRAWRFGNAAVSVLDAAPISSSHGAAGCVC